MVRIRNFPVPGDDDKNPGPEEKCLDSIFDWQVHFTVLNTKNLKIFLNHDGTYSFERKFNKTSRERKSPKESIEKEW